MGDDYQVWDEKKKQPGPLLCELGFVIERRFGHSRCPQCGRCSKCTKLPAKWSNPNLARCGTCRRIK